MPKESGKHATSLQETAAYSPPGGSHKCINCQPIGQSCTAGRGQCCSNACNVKNKCNCVISGQYALGVGPQGEEWKICCSQKMGSDGTCL